MSNSDVIYENAFNAATEARIEDLKHHLSQCSLETVQEKNILGQAVRYGHKNIIKMLEVDFGISIAAYPNVMLGYAAIGGQKDLVAQILQLEVTQFDLAIARATHTAHSHALGFENQLEIIKLLSQKAKEVNGKVSYGLALAYAARNECENIFHWMLGESLLNPDEIYPLDTQSYETIIKFAKEGEDTAFTRNVIVWAEKEKSK